MLEVNGLRVSYGGIQAVRGITFHVNEGEMVALIGANGAGKSSTLRALSDCSIPPAAASAIAARNFWPCRRTAWW
jgi:ABC-type branched-subunit amino acid transport system ATPase component